MGDYGWMVGLLVFVFIGCVVLWAAQKLMAAWELPQPIATTVWIVLVVVFALAFAVRIVPGLLH